MALASLQRVETVEPIQGADYIEKITVLGWSVVAKKGEFKPGDICVYFELDAILPKEAPWAEFMAERKFRVKTIKLRKVLSQGLALPLKDCMPMDGKTRHLGDDVTELLGVKKYSAEEAASAGNPLRSKRARSAPPFPVALLPKTDETRLQSAPFLLKYFEGIEFTATEKMDGSSGTFFNHEGKFRLCSRNLELDWFRESAWWHIFVFWWIVVLNVFSKKKADEVSAWFNRSTDTAYHKVALKYGLAAKIPEGYALQGEVCGPSIQKNRLNLKDYDLYVFNVWSIRDHEYLSHEEMRIFMEKHMPNVPTVPVVRHEWFDPEKHTMEFFLELAKGNYFGTQNRREGIVVRPRWSEVRTKNGQRLSFKAINNDFLLKDED